MIVFDILRFLLRVVLLNAVTIGGMTWAFYQLLGSVFTSSVDPNLAFWAIFGLRYTRVLVHTFAYFCYRAAPVPATPNLTAQDVTVVVPTVDPGARNFIECIASICRTKPHTIIVVTVGPQLEAEATRNLAFLQPLYPGIQFQITSAAQANKRVQVAHAARMVSTTVTFLADASVFWGPNFLVSALAAFEDSTVYLVGTNKRVRLTTRDDLSRFIPMGFLFNFFGSTYLGRHNFEIRATNYMDGGLFAVSGRTMGIRTILLQDPALINGFLNEKVSNTLGPYIPALNQPLLPDDDNYITRQIFNRGHKVKIQYTEDARVEIAGDQFTYPRYFSQCLRWARSTFRSNVASLVTERSAWGQWWSTYAVYVNGMVNFALFCDGCLVYHLLQSSYAGWLIPLICWIIVSKIIKLFPYFVLYPRELVFFPAYILFAYFHSLLKLLALCTFWEAAWSGRNLAAIGNPPPGDGSPPPSAPGSPSLESANIPPPGPPPSRRRSA